MFGIGLFIGGFIGLMVAWAVCVVNETDDSERTLYMVICLCIVFVSLIIATVGHYEGWFEIAEKVVEVVQ